MTECAHDDVAARDLGHPPAGELERVVGGLVVQDLDHDDHALLAGNLGGDTDLVREAQGLRDRRDLVHDHAAHGAHHGRATRGPATPGCAPGAAVAAAPARW